MALEADNASAHALLGAIQHQFEGNWPQARLSFERAIALAPLQAFVHSAYGYHLQARGEAVAADRELTLARRLDPQYINSRMHIVNLRISQGRLDQAEIEIEAIRDMAPDSMAVVGMCGSVAMFRRDAAAAITHYQRAFELAPDHPGCMVTLAAAYGLAGRLAEADAKIAELHRRFADRFISPYALAIVETRCGRHQQAFTLLDQSLRQHDPNGIFSPLDPSFDELHADPRWAALVERVQPTPRLHRDRLAGSRTRGAAAGGRIQPVKLPR